MPDMFEIYAQHALEYDALVNSEDYQENLAACLQQLPWKDKTVCEAGIGTGRVTRLYAPAARWVYGFDQSAHMLERCQRNLNAAGLRHFSLARADHVALPLADQVADAYLEGWAWGHAIMAQPEDVETTTQRLLAEAERVIKPGSPIILIETLGTCTERAAPTREASARFYQALEQRHGFQRTVIRTDYRFESVEEAIQIMGFFFGEGLAQRVRQHGQAIVPEFTGVWTRG